MARFRMSLSALAIVLFCVAIADARWWHRSVAYYPAPVAVARPVVVASPVVVQRPVVVQQPVVQATYAAPVTTYAPVVPPAVVPVRPGPVYFYSPYGGWEVRVPGQPVRNTLRAIFP